MKETEDFTKLIDAAAKADRQTNVGRLVDCSQADDRRVIALVRERPLLYTRTTLPVASYYAQVKTLWQEVADNMGWTASEVRRKWSHIRNSYSRHLRNEMAGARTGRGRKVSRWYLADELIFLREHMATDVRGTSYTMTPTSMLKMEMNEMDPISVTGEFTPTRGTGGITVTGGTSVSSWDDNFQPHESSSYFEFFRGMYREYEDLEPRNQRAFKRQCLALLHALLDQQEDQRRVGDPNSEHNERSDLERSDHECSDHERSDQESPERKVFVRSRVGSTDNSVLS